MALTASELLQIKYELGYNLLEVGAEPYISIVALFDQVIQPYLASVTQTTSTTAVTAATTPTPVTLTLASATGFAAGDVVVVDVDTRQERATIQSLSGADITVQLSNTHSGTYPVVLEGAESIVRRLLRQLRDAGTEQVSSGTGAAGVKKVDEIEFFGGSTSGAGARFTALQAERMRLRDELASVLGAPNMWRRKASAGATMALY